MQTNLQEQQLLVGARAGDQASCEKLYQLWYEPVYALAYGVLREKNAAAGVLRDTFSTAWENLNVFPASEPFGRWVQRICYMHCDEYQRRAGKTPELEDSAARELLADADPDTFRLPQPYTVQPELRARLERVIAALPDRQQRALTLYYNNQLGVEDTAAVMGLRPTQVQSHLALARREIVRLLRAEERDAGEELPWGTAAETVPFMDAMHRQVLGSMLAGSAAGAILYQTLASLTAGGAAA